MNKQPLKGLQRTLFCDWKALFPQSTIDLSAISDDCVENVTDSLNDDHQGYKYSTDQVHRAMWNMLENHIDRYLEEIEDHFGLLDSAERDRLLGEPEIDIKEEQRLEKGDYDYDRSKGN